ncbi:MAG: shikimate kinase [Candidatus Cloacimonetes bacterium]|nr:shikimate kinase [Candidatus Cloacimonadota bacterium]
MMIFLIGFMGSGKTYLGKKAASELKLSFYDLDNEIEKKTGLSISKIFENKGERYFREIESEILLNWDKPGIIATGGGVIEMEKNRNFLKKQKTIWLDVDWETIYSRIEKSKRPLVKQLTKNDLFTLYDKRINKYRICANNTYNSNEINLSLFIKHCFEI